MRRLSAHYILHNSQLIQYGTIVLDEHNCFVCVELPQQPYKEQSGIEFYNGVLAVVAVNYNIDEVKITPQIPIETIFCDKLVKTGQDVQILQISPVNMDNLSTLSDTLVIRL